MDKQIIALIKRYTGVKSKGDIEKWLLRGIELMVKWKNKVVTTIVSPSHKFDPVVKMIT